MSNVRLILENRKSECCILMSWQVVHIHDKFHTQVDTFSNVNVLQRINCTLMMEIMAQKVLLNLVPNPWHSAYIGVRLCTPQKEVIIALETSYREK